MTVDRKIMCAIAVMSLLLWMPGTGRAADFYAAPSGDDGYDCGTAQRPCKSAQAAIRKMAPGAHALYLAPGRYDEVLDVSHGRQVSISGLMLDPAGSCTDARAVTVNRVWVQDNATVWVTCLTTGAITCRQWSIVDAIDVRFDGTSRTALVANETCRINTARILWVDGPIVVFASATNYSTIYLAGNIVIEKPNLSLSYFLTAEDATLDLSGAVFSGHSLAAGLQFRLDHGVLVLPQAGIETIPGKGAESTNHSICRPALCKYD
jgi:hypothetical protein